MNFFTQEKWNDGPPPITGWWHCECGWIRYWDGKRWSFGAMRTASPETVRRAAGRKIAPHLTVRWLYWDDSWMRKHTSREILP